MNLRNLKYFVAVYQLKSFSAAAKACYIAQPSISSAVAQLESELNALACFCHELFLQMEMVGEIRKYVGMPTTYVTSRHMFVHEDNSSALNFAQTMSPHFTSGRKWYANKTVQFFGRKYKVRDSFV